MRCGGRLGGQEGRVRGPLLAIMSGVIIFTLGGTLQPAPCVAPAAGVHWQRGIHRGGGHRPLQLPASILPSHRLPRQHARRRPGGTAAGLVVHCMHAFLCALRHAGRWQLCYWQVCIITGSCACSPGRLGRGPPVIAAGPEQNPPSPAPPARPCRTAGTALSGSPACGGGTTPPPGAGGCPAPLMSSPCPPPPACCWAPACCSAAPPTNRLSSRPAARCGGRGGAGGGWGSGQLVWLPGAILRSVHAPKGCWPPCFCLVHAPLQIELAHHSTAHHMAQWDVCSAGCASPVLLQPRDHLHPTITPHTATNTTPLPRPPPAAGPG